MHNAGGHSLTRGTSLLESAGRGGGMFGCGTVWEAGGGKFSFPTHKTAEIFRADFFVAVTMML